MDSPDNTDTFTIESSGRLDHFLRDALPHLSRRHLRRLLESREILVNGRPARKGDGLRPGDTVSLNRTLSQATALRPQADLGLRLVYADDIVVAIDKPCGMPSIAQRITDRDTVANFVAGRFPETAGLDGKPFESGIVHRLDTATSGVLLAAMNLGARRALRRQFSNHEVAKVYLAVSRGRIGPRGTRGTISASLRARRGKGGRVVLATTESAGARPAESEFRVLDTNRTVSLLEVRIRSGARHQIRVHLASRGTPIVGDTLYGAPAAGSEVPPAGSDVPPVGRMLLHAQSVQFTHPGSSERTVAEAPIPPDYRAALDALGLRLPVATLGDPG